jgi:hypothetical protein
MLPVCCWFVADFVTAKSLTISICHRVAGFSDLCINFAFRGKSFGRLLRMAEIKGGCAGLRCILCFSTAGGNISS